MIGFVIPFKSSAKSKNWKLDSALLRRTLSSVLNQTSDKYKCYVVYTDLPLDPLQHEKVTWIKFPFDFLESHQIEDEERSAVRYRLGKFLPAFYDQGKRSIYGCSIAKKDGCQYLMSLDADDLLSNKLAGFIEENTDKNIIGWYVSKGYMYVEKSSFLVKVPDRMNFMCASVNIIRHDIVPDPDFTSTRYQDFQFFSSHAYMPEGIKQLYDKDLHQVPFYCTTYVLHSTNFFTDSTYLTKINFRNILKRIIRGKYLSKKLKKEFGLYNLAL